MLCETDEHIFLINPRKGSTDEHLKSFSTESNPPLPIMLTKIRRDV